MTCSENIRQVFFPERSFWKDVLRFGTSVALQYLTLALFGIIDVSVISNMGEDAVSAVSLANQVFYVASLITFGITSGGSVILSRYYGAGDDKAVRKAFAIMAFLSTVVNTVIMIASFVIPRQLLALYTNEPVLIADGALYLFITAPMNIFYGISNSMAYFFRSVNRPSIPMIISILTLALKTGMNVVFIYGWGAIPAMGVAGAALATLLCKVLELCFFMVFYLRFQEKKYCFQFSDLKYLQMGNIKKFLQETVPIILNESLWGIGISSFNMIFGRMGTVAVSAMSVAQQMEKLGNSFFYGISMGACVTISTMLGKKKYEDAKLAAKRYAVVGAYVGILVMGLMLCTNHTYVSAFFKDLTEETRRMAEWMIVVYALYMPFRSFASALIMGSLRAGGDGKRAMYYDVLPVYLWSLPIGFVLGVWLKLPVVAVLAAMQFKRVIKSVLALGRLVSGKWLKCGDA